MCCGCTLSTKIWWCTSMAIITGSISVLIGMFFPGTFNTILNSQLAITEYSIMWQNWIERPIPLYMELYLYNWSNVERMENYKEELPHFQEFGPYVFEESCRRVNLQYSEDKTSVKFLENKTWIFRPDLSKGRLTDRIYNANPIAMTVNWFARYLENISPVKLLVGEILKKYTTVYIGKTAGEWIFDGFEDGFLDSVQTILNSSLIPPGTLPEFPYDKFGWFYNKNNSAEANGILELYTGKGDISKLGSWKSFNNKDTVPGVTGECAKIKGTTGELWAPPDKNKDISFFNADLCRSVKFKRDGNYKTLGLTGYKWVGDDSVFDNGEKYAENKCYCKGSEDECPKLKSGVFDAGACSFGAPAFMSYPHFYLADPYYLESLSGLQPNEEQHASRLALDPITGVAINANIRFQINMFMRQDNNISMFRSVPNMFVPMMWFNQKAEIDDKFANLLKIIKILKISMIWLCYTLAGIAGALILTIFVAIYLNKKEKGKLVERTK